MDYYAKMAEERKKREEDKKAKTLSLEKQLKMWKARQEELRKIGSSAIDPVFVRRQLDKCDAEISKINRIISTL